MTTTAVNPVPRAPWRIWRSPYLWLATIHLLGDAVVAVVGGLLVLLMLAVAALAWPLAYLGIPLTIAATRVVYAVGRVERARAAITRDQSIPPLLPPARTGSTAADTRAALVDRALWRQVGYYVLLLGMAFVGILAIVLAWSVPPVLIALPFFFSKFSANRAQLGPFTIENTDQATAVAVIALLFLLVVSPLHDPRPLRGRRRCWPAICSAPPRQVRWPSGSINW